MIPIVTPTQMRAIDARAPEPVEVLVDRAARAVARRAVSMLGGTYGRRVALLAGKGFNGEDARVAATHLERRGVRTVLLAPDVTELPAVDLVIDGAYGTGLSRPWAAPPQAGRRVLAIDIPSGVYGLTGEAPSALVAEHTVTFAALKPGLVLMPGRSHAGTVEVVDIGLDITTADPHLVADGPMSARGPGRAVGDHTATDDGGAGWWPHRGVDAYLVTDDDVAGWWPQRAVDAHKWHHAVWVIGGSAGMTGAPLLAARAAQRSGSGYVRLSVPGAGPAVVGAVEVVGHELPAVDWHRGALDSIDRFGAAVIGPGLGTSAEAGAAVRAIARGSDRPMVIDADGIRALGPIERLAPNVVLTPHDGEFEALTGHRPGADRFAAVRDLAERLDAHVLLKGPTTLVGAPDGRVLVSTTGDDRLATAGSGDVLAGIIAAFMAAGIEPFRAAAAGAHVHGRVAEDRERLGMVAADLIDSLPAVLGRLVGRGPRPLPTSPAGRGAPIPRDPDPARTRP